MKGSGGRDGIETATRGFSAGQLTATDQLHTALARISLVVKYQLPNRTVAVGIHLFRSHI